MLWLAEPYQVIVPLVYELWEGEISDTCYHLLITWVSRQIPLNRALFAYGAWDFQFRDYFLLVARCIVHACARRSYTMSSYYTVKIIASSGWHPSCLTEWIMATWIFTLVKYTFSSHLTDIVCLGEGVLHQSFSNWVHDMIKKLHLIRSKIL